ncbi:MAG: oligosaccharide flippase family protein [Caldilineaceae bacterium]
MLKNGIYNLVGAVLRLIVVVATIPLLIRLIGIQEYGLWTIVNAVVSMATLAEVGLSISTTVFLSKDFAANDDKAVSETLTIIVGLIVVLATIASILLWLEAGLVVKLFRKLTTEEQETAVTAIKLGSVAVWARLLQQVLIGPIQALQRYVVINIVNTLQTVITNTILLLVAVKGGQTVELTVGLSAVAFLFFLVFVAINVILLRDRLITIRFNRSKFFAIGGYSTLTWTSSLGGQLFSQGDRIIVGSVLGTTSLGIYAAITSVTVQITALTAMAVSPLLPRLSAIWQYRVSKYDLLCIQLKQATDLNSLVTLGSGSAMFVLGPYFLHLLLPDPITKDTIIAFQIATLIYAVYLLNAVGYYLLFAIDAVRSNLVINFASGIFALLLIAIGAHLGGVVGAISGNTGYAASLLFVYYGLRYVGLPFSHWVRWISIPVIWFFLVVAVNLILNDRVELRIGIYSLQVLGFLMWFGYSQRELLQAFLRQMQFRSN